MKLRRMLWSAVLLSAGPGIALAEEASPADPPPDESDLGPIGWKKTLGEARQAASARNGYALLLVTGANAASERIEMTVLWWPQVVERLKEDYGCVKGTMEELSRDDQARAKLSAAGVTEAPALILIEPEDGSVVDVTRREFTPRQMERLLEDVDKGLTQKGLEEKVSREPGNAELRLLMGQARMRRADHEAARKDFEIALKSEDKRVVAQAKIGLAAGALLSADYKQADRLLADALGMLVDEQEVQDFESPMAEALHLLALSAWKQDLREDATKYARRALETWPMSATVQLMCGEGQDMDWDWYEGKEIPK